MAQANTSNEMLVAALSGGLGSAVAKLFTYPLEISKTWLMRKPSDETAADCLRQLWKTGLYTGFKSKAFKSFTQKFIYFYLYEWLLRTAVQLQNSARVFRGLDATTKISTWAFLCSGYFGEACSIPLSAPLEYVAVQVQTSRTHEGPLSVISRTLRESGAAGFYRGWEVYLLCAFQPMVQFTLVEQAKAILLQGQDRQGAVLSAAAAFWLGALTKAVASTLTYPINLGRVIIQGHAKNASASASTDNALVAPKEQGCDSSTNIFVVLRGVMRREGVRGLYKGLTGEVAEGLFGAAILLMVKERVTLAIRKVLVRGT